MKKHTLILILIISQIFLSCLNENQEYETFGIYLTDNDELVLSDKHIDAYIKLEHQIRLNDEGIKQWSSFYKYDSSFSPPIPKLGSLYKKEFAIKLDNDEMYRGKFWSNVSSASCDRIVIMDVMLLYDGNILFIEAGYATAASNSTLIELRNQNDIYDFFDSKGKLE